MKRGRHLSAHIHCNSVKLLISFDTSRKYFKKSSSLGVLIQSVTLTSGAFEELLGNIGGSVFMGFMDLFSLRYYIELYGDISKTLQN